MGRGKGSIGQGCEAQILGSSSHWVKLGSYFPNASMNFFTGSRARAVAISG